MSLCVSTVHTCCTHSSTDLMSAIISAGDFNWLGSPEAKSVLPYQIFVTCDSRLSERILSDTAESALQRLARAMRSLLTLFLPDSDFLFASYLFASDLVCRVHFVLCCSLISFASLFLSLINNVLKVTEPPSNCSECQ